MVMRGHWRLSWGEEELYLNPGDTCWVPPALEHQIEVSMSGEAAIFRVTRTDDAAGLTWSDAN
jgi:AraC-like ligand binding domain.